jgi:hypothetical protein
MKIWIDPPSGWQYGFPKIYNREVDGDDCQAWLIREGYPESEITRLGQSFYWRSWEATEQGPEFRRGVPTKNG